MPAAGKAVPAAAADHMSFAADQLPRKEIHHIGTDLDDLANKLMADHHGNRDGPRGPGVPVEDVNVRTANRGFLDTNQHVVDADFRDGNFFKPKPRLGPALDQSLHQTFRFHLTSS